MQSPRVAYLTSYDSLNSTDTPANCTLKLNTALQNVKKIKLSQFTIPNTIYNVRTGINDQVCWNRLATNYNFQIPKGQYTILTLLSTIQTGMNGIDANTYVCTYNTNNFLVTISGASTFFLNWNSNPQAATGCYKQLGFAKTDLVTATSQTAVYAPDLSYPEFIFVSIAEIPNFLTTTSSLSTSNRFSFCIPLLDSGSSLLFISPETMENTVEFASPISLYNISVNLKDKDGNFVDTIGAHWHQTWELEYFDRKY
jgi:hypothetical protein